MPIWSLIVWLVLGAAIAYAVRSIPALNFLGTPTAYGLMGDAIAAALGALVLSFLLGALLLRDVAGLTTGGIIFGLLGTIIGALAGIFILRKLMPVRR